MKDAGLTGLQGALTYAAVAAGDHGPIAPGMAATPGKRRSKKVQKKRGSSARGRPFRGRFRVFRRTTGTAFPKPNPAATTPGAAAAAATTTAAATGGPHQLGAGAGAVLGGSAVSGGSAVAGGATVVAGSGAARHWSATGQADIPWWYTQLVNNLGAAASPSG